MADASTSIAAGVGIATAGAAAGSFVATGIQNWWQRNHSARQQAIDFRTLQLALLEPRLEVLKVIAFALEQASFHAPPRDDQQDRLYGCLLAGQTLFDAGVAARLQEAWTAQVEYLNARIARSANSTKPRAIGDFSEEDRLTELREGFFERLKALHAEMIAASRVPGPFGSL